MLYKLCLEDLSSCVPTVCIPFHHFILLTVFPWTFSTITNVTDIVQVVERSVRSVVGSLYSLNFHSCLCCSVVSAAIQQRLQISVAGLQETGLLFHWFQNHLSSRGLMFSLQLHKESGLKNSGKGKRRKEWIRVDIRELLFLVRGINGVKHLVNAPQTKRIYPLYATRISPL